MHKLLINPYTVGPPVVGGSFYGRDKLIAQVGRSLRGTNVVLLQGQRRIGKTSFLKQMAYFLSHEKPENPTLPMRVPVLFDIQRYVQDTLPQFQMHLAGAIIRSMGLSQEKSFLIQSLADWETDAALFQDKWLPQIYKHLSNRELVILVDEFDNFDGQTAPHSTQFLMPFLRQLVSGETRLRWVFTLGKLSGKMSLEYDRIIRSGEEIRLGCLTYTETRNLIVKPASAALVYQKKAIERIFKLTNGQPHLTQAICSKIFEYLTDKNRNVVRIETVDSVITQTLEAYAGAIASIVSVPPIEEKVLTAVAQLTDLNESTTRSQVIDLLISNSVSLNLEDVSNAIRSLLEWGLVKGNDETLRVSIKLIQLWLVQNRVVEPTQQENLNIQYALAQSRFEFAEKARQLGQYDLSIKDYQESLGYIPGNVKTLRGLAEAYRLSNNLSGRVETLKNLYLYDQDILDEMIEVLVKYAHECKEAGNFSGAAEQYDFLLTIKNHKDWQRENIRIRIAEFGKQIEELERKLLLYQQTDYALIAAKTLRKNTIQNDNERERVVLLDDVIQNRDDMPLTSIVNQMNRSDSEEDKVELESSFYYDGIMKDRDLMTEFNRRSEILQKSDLKRLEIMSFDLTNTRQGIESKLEEKTTSQSDLGIIKSFLESLILKEQILAKRVQIEHFKNDYDPGKVASILLEIEATGESLSKEEDELLNSAVFDRTFGSTISSFKVVLLILFLVCYLVPISWLVKDWYIKAFVTAITGFLIVIGMIIPAIFYFLMDGAFSLLKKSALRVIKRFRPMFLRPLYFQANQTKSTDL